MSRKKTSTKQLLAQATFFTLIVVAGLWLGAWILSVPTSSASGALPALLTFQSPIGDPHLGLVKSVDDEHPQPGDEIEYTLTYSATDPGNPDAQAFNVRLYDFLPAGVQFVSSDPTASHQAGTLLFDIPSISGTNRIATVRVRVLEGYELLYNHALMMADFVTPTHDSLLTTVEQPPKWLNLTKLGDTAVLTGSEMIYTLRCENPSNITVNDVTVMDVLPTGVTLVSASPPPDPGWTLPVLTWSLGDLGPGASQVIVITATAPASAGLITNTALADARQRVMTQTVFATQVVTEAAILRVTKHGSPTEVDVGDELVYTLRYENIGNQAATGVVLTDILPFEVTVTGIYSSATLIVPDPLVWDIGTLSQTTSGEIIITVTVDGGWGGTLHNAADVTASYGFPGHADLYTPVGLAKIYLPVVMRNY